MSRLTSRLSIASILISLAGTVGLSYVVHDQQQTRDAVKSAKLRDAETRAVTERLRADAAESAAQTERNRQGVDLFYVALETIGIPILTVDGDGNVTTWNRAAEKKFGWRERDLIGKPLSVLMPDDRVNVKHVTAFRKGVVRQWVEKRIGLDCWVKTKSGDLRHVYVQTYLADHPPSKYLAVIHTPEEIIIKQKPDQHEVRPSTGGSKP